MMCPMPTDDVTPAVMPGSRPSHHSGPGYVANPKAPDFELDAPLKDAAARWLDLVPAGHRHDARESAKDALETLREHTRSCPGHPLGALWVAHRHLRDPVPAVRIASLVLASEALWWLGHFEDARTAAQAAVDADPGSAQALWRLAVALYRLGRFEEAGGRLDDLLKLASRFAPAWALRGQVSVWLDADNPEAGRADFAAAAALTSDSGTWVVPYRMKREAFEAKVAEEIRIHDSEVGGSSSVFTEVEWLPETSKVENGLDPDTRWHVPEVSPGLPGNSVLPLGGGWNAGTPSQLPIGATFILYQRNIESLSKDEETVRKEIQESVTEIFDQAYNLRARIADKVPEEHAETADVPEDKDR